MGFLYVYEIRDVKKLVIYFQENNYVKLLSKLNIRICRLDFSIE